MEEQQVEAGGRIERREEPEFLRQFGTPFALVDEIGGEVSYALKSDTEELEEYAGRSVRVRGFLVEGFPVEPGAPGYISVTEVVGEG